MVNVDPIAKACIPAFVEIYIDSDEYGPTFEDKQRVMYNLLYRLGVIYYNTYLIDDAVKEFLEDYADGSPETADDKDITEYVLEAKELGSLVGD
mgnify:CR=1 FL=1